MRNPPIGTVVLAAGAAERMGCLKQLLKVGQRSLLRRAAEAAVALEAGPVAIVVGAHADIVAPEVADLPVIVVTHGEWSRGMGGSIRAGLEALQPVDELAGILVTLADQPLVGREALCRIITEFDEGGAPAVASSFDGTVGAPVLFGPSWYGRLDALHGDQGARRLLRSNPTEIRLISVPEAAFDVDTPADFDRALCVAGG